jgi:hypothetical protein
MGAKVSETRSSAFGGKALFARWKEWYRQKVAEQGAE